LIQPSNRIGIKPEAHRRDSSWATSAICHRASKPKKSQMAPDFAEQQN
jgi:hypothetical protein